MTVIRWIKKGVFPNARRVGTAYRVPLSDYQKWHEGTKIALALDPTADRSFERSQ